MASHSYIFTISDAGRLEYRLIFSFLKIAVFWDELPSSLAEVHTVAFKRTHYLHQAQCTVCREDVVDTGT
jgi:hypothetical protein